VWPVMSDRSAKYNSMVSTLGPEGTDSENEARKHFSKIRLFPTFVDAVDYAEKNDEYALVPAGYLDYQNGELADTWVALHFRLIGRMRVVALWESPTKAMCLAINRERAANRESIRTIALHPATAVFAKQACAGADVTYVNAKPLAVNAAASGRVDACIGSVDVIAKSALEPVEFFYPTMVWFLYGSLSRSAPLS
jgi:prephenate dehydratase